MRNQRLILGVFAFAALAFATSGCNKKEETVALGMKKVTPQTESTASKASSVIKKGAMPAGHPAVEEGQMPPGHPAMGGAAGAMPQGHPAIDGAGEPLPPGHPPTGAMGHMGAPSQDMDDNEVPLRNSGPGSLAEMKVGLNKITDNELKKTFEGAWRVTFTPDKAKRDPNIARAGFDKVLATMPNLAEAYRALAYVALSDGFNREKAEAMYNKALEYRPEYPEVHAALAVLVQDRDAAQAAEHRRKAKEGGI